MSKVTVIVPAYNVEQYIRKCLDSLLNQTYQDITVFVVSDGSPDRSLEIAKEYVAKDSMIQCFEKENGGYGSVLEYALEKIESEYFLICDPDDWLSKDAIEKLVSLAEKNGNDITIGCKYWVYNGSDETVYHDCRILKNQNYISEEKCKDRSLFYFIDPSPHAKLYKTSLCKGIKLPHKVSFTDTLLYLYALNRADRFYFTKEALAYYLIDRPGNSMSTYKDKTFQDHIVILKELLSYAKEYPMLYGRLYNQLHFALSEMKNHGSSKTKENFLEEYSLIAKEILAHKKEIIDSYPFMSSKEKLKFTLNNNPLLFESNLKKWMGM